MPGKAQTKMKSAKQEPTRLSIVQLEAYGALLSLFAVVLFLSLVTYDRQDVGIGIENGTDTNNLLGPVGAHMANLFLWVVGVSAFLVDALFAWIGIRAVIRRPVRLSMGPVIWGLVAVLMSVIFLQAVLDDTRVLGHHPGGFIGLYAGEVMAALFSRTGAVILSVAVLAIAATYLSGRSLATGLRWLWQMAVSLFSRAAARVSATMISAWRSLRHRLVSQDPPAGDDGTDGDETVEDEHDTRVELRRGLRPFRFEDKEEDATGDPSWVKHPAPKGPESLEVEDEPQEPRNPSVPKETSADESSAEGPKIVVRKRKTPKVQGSLALDDRASQGLFEPPPMSLLDFVESKSSPVDRENLRHNAETLERKLLDFKVDGRVVEIHPGPVITMYEFLPAPGVKISQIAHLADDLTMALSAMSIRIVAPIPGKGVVGIEVPNEVRETVYLREVLASDAFSKARSKLTLALGKDIFGTPMVTDLAKMPHLLIAGATGSGKSVAVNAFLMSLLYNASPEDVRIILVDPKVVELQMYEGVPHLLLPVVYDPKHAAAALRWSVEEMERRYELLARFGTRNIVSYNQRVKRLLGGRSAASGLPEESDTSVNGPAEPELDTDEGETLQKLPYLVIVLDEFADLMMVASKDVETAVARLAQKARAAGIHLVMATQRPSKEVITGLIKANFTSRISFRVSSKVDSRIILDQGGADALLGYGDMLHLKPGSSLLTRIHGPFVSEEEVQRVVDHLKSQGEPDYDMEILQSGASEDPEDMEDADPLLGDAIEIIMESRRASISYLQRRLKVGYNRAARIMEQVELRGIVGPPDSRGERQVLG